MFFDLRAFPKFSRISLLSLVRQYLKFVRFLKFTSDHFFTFPDKNSKILDLTSWNPLFLPIKLLLCCLYFTVLFLSKIISPPAPEII